MSFAHGCQECIHEGIELLEGHLDILVNNAGTALLLHNLTDCQRLNDAILVVLHQKQIVSHMAFTLHVLVHMAPVLKDLTVETWDWHMNVNLRSVFICSQAGCLLLCIHIPA